MSTSIGGWAARIPAIRARVGIGDAGWGLANTAGAVVNLAALGVVAGVLVGRVTPRRLAVIGAAGNLLVMPAVAQATDFTTLTVGLSAWFTASCVMGIPSGALQIEVQRRYQRPLQGSFIACFGAGTFAGAGFATAAAALGITVGLQFAMSSLLLLAVLGFTARWLPHERLRSSSRAHRQRLRHRFTPLLRVLAAVAGLSQFITTTLELWAAYYIAISLGAGAETGAAAYTVMSVTGIVAALGADRIIARFGALPVFRAGTVLAAVSMAAGLAVNGVLPTVAGFVLLGVGMSCVGPTIYSFISDQAAVAAAEAVSVIELGDSAGALIAPTVIGGLAGLVGLRSSLATIAAAALIMTVLAHRGPVRRH